MRRKVVGGVLVAVGVGLSTWALFLRKAPGSVETAALVPAVIRIMSEPSGATVIIEGVEVGHTPYFGDNRWGGLVPFELRLAGYRPKQGTFPGGVEAAVSLDLQRTGGAAKVAIPVPVPVIDAGVASVVEPVVDAGVRRKVYRPRGPDGGEV